MLPPEQQQQQPYTILRIKRKRNEEPLDALVIESGARRKKSRPSAGIFQFAQTIEEGVWEDGVQQKLIQDQLARLARLSQPVPPQPTSLSPSKPRREISDPNHHYTVVERETPKTEAPWQAQPPSVLSSKDLEEQKANADFKMYDAIRSDDVGKNEELDPQMEKLLPMLQDYLRTTDPALADSVTSAQDDDYVWDLFYHAPGSAKDWTQTSTVGTVAGLPPLGTQDDSDSDTDSEVEDEANEDSNSEGYYKNDYPDEESDSDSDGSEGSGSYHDGSDIDDYDDGSDHEWR
ncbi:hypothetical protein D9758_006062 [Tetrapyrgos nigripes]|uniref:Probable RNA polymerase II nuclear localization protein SLC7A6OS n=1 Tax=Tetrapyrgos nigripes TaxID=182062 RepID=A0A8H5G079_9AGAR|nr:hypothetical protein D9758_006062 [Tetrapyrgos nigripes]